MIKDFLPNSYLDMGNVVLRKDSFIQAPVHLDNQSVIKGGKIIGFKPGKNPIEKNEDKIVVFKSYKKTYEVEARYCQPF